MAGPGHRRTARAGVSLLEALVALAILSLVLGASAAGLRGPSPRLRLQGELAELRRGAAETRARAVLTGTPAALPIEAGCGAPASMILFLADGTARGVGPCLESGDAVLWLDLDPLTGRLEARP